MRERRNLILLLIGGVVISGLIAREGKILILAIPLLVYFTIGLIQAPTQVALRAERWLSKDSVSEHEPVGMRIRVENQGESLANLYLKDEQVTSGEPILGRLSKSLSLPKGGTAELEYTLHPKRGIYSWASIKAYSADPLGLFVHQHQIEAPGELLVRPSQMSIRPLFAGFQSTKLASGPIPARRAGTGTNYWGVREYKPGDSLRRLNWRLVARHPGKLYTNEFEREEIADFGLILDTRRLSSYDTMEEMLFEHAISAAASIAEMALKMGNRVSLLLFGQRMSSIFPGFGKHQLNRVLKGLGGARLGEYVPFSYLEYFPVRLFPSRAMIIILSQLDQRDMEGYASLRANGYDVLLVSPDPVEYAFQSTPSSARRELAYRAARIERIILLERLIRMGVRVANWRVDTPLDNVLREGMLAVLPNRRQ